MSLIDYINSNPYYNDTTVLHLTEHYGWITPRSVTVAHIRANINHYSACKVLHFFGRNIDYVYVPDSEEERLDRGGYILRTAGRKELELFISTCNS